MDIEIGEFRSAYISNKKESKIILNIVFNKFVEIEQRRKIVSHRA